MAPESRLLAAVAAFLLGPALSAAVSSPAIVIRLGEDPPRMTESAPPPVYFSIPKYTLSATERQTLAACLVLEAANQGEFGMRSVMAVIRNRARGLPELLTPTVLREKQFSAFNKLTSGRETLTRTVERARRDAMWPTALAIVDAALEETWHDPTHGATHYTRTGERTGWTRSLAKTVVIGAHSFYR